MNVAIIGASEESLHGIELAKKYGLKTVTLDGNKDAKGLSLGDHQILVDISKEEPTIEALRKEEIAFIIPVPIGRYLTTIGGVNDTLLLKGVSKEAAVFCTDKYAFHTKLQTEQLRSGRCMLLSGLGQENRDKQIKELYEMTYPAIAKPRYGSGSRGIFFLENQKELEDTILVLSEDCKEDYIVEEVASGQEYGVDGAVIDGTLSLILVRRKINTPPPERQAVGYISVFPGVLQEKMQEHLSQIKKCIGLNHCLFHADIMVDGDQIYVIELSARPSGHNLHNLFTPLCTGVDPIEEFIKYQMGLPFSFTPVLTDGIKAKLRMIHYFNVSKGSVIAVPSKEEIEQLVGSMAVTLLEWNCNIAVGDQMEKVVDGHSVMGRGFFILEGNKQEDMIISAEEIIKKILVI